MHFNWLLSRIDAHIPQLSAIFFSQMPHMSSSCFGMISDKGGGAMVTMFARGAWHGGSISLLNLVKLKIVCETNYCLIV